MARGGVVLPILTEFKPQGIDKALKEFEKLETTSQKVGFALNKAFLPAVAVTGALAAGFVNLSLAGERAATSNARIAQIAESMGLFGTEVDFVTKRLVDLAKATARQTGLDQNAIKETQAKLLTFKELAATAGEVGGQFDRATAAAIDLAAAGFGSAESNAVQLGKALQDPIKGLTALSRSGVTFTDTEKDRIQTLVESNRIGEAQVLILEAIETQVGGTAAATANSSDKMRVAFSQMQESMGQALLPVFEKLTGIASSFFDLIGRNETAVLVVAGAVGVLAAAIVAANVAMKIYSGLATLVKITNTLLGTSFELTGAKMAGMAKGLGLIGAAVGVAAFIYADYNRHKEKMNQLHAESIGLLDAMNSNYEDVARSIVVNMVASQENQKALQALGLTHQDYLAFVRGEAVPGLDALQEAVNKGVSSIPNLAKTYGGAADQVFNFGVKLEAARVNLQRQVETNNTAQTATQNLTDDQAKLSSQLSVSEQVSRDMAEAMRQAGLSMDDYTDSVISADQALNRMIDTSLAMFNTDLQLRNQIDRTAEAIEKYTAELQAGTLVGRDLEKAQRDVTTEALRQAEAAVKAAQAQAELAGETFDASTRQQVLVDNLRAVSNSLSPNDPLRRELAGYIAQLNSVPDSIVTRVTAIREELVTQRITQIAEESPTGIAGGLGGGPFFIRRQIGGPIPGPVNRGVPVLAHGGEYVLSADVVDAIKRGAPSVGLGRGRGAASAGNVINVTVTSADPQAVIEAIRRYNRQNGPAPIKVAS
jgi:hypothetical protein